MDKQYWEESRQYHLNRARKYLEEYRNAKSDRDKQFFKSSAEDEIKRAKRSDEWSRE